MHPPPPSTPRLTFRPLTPADLDLLVSLDADPEVMRHINQGLPTSRERFESDILPHWLELYALGPSRGFWATEHPEGEFIGWFHLKPAHHWPAQLELGYRLRREAWGRGLATEGAVGLLTHALRTLGEPMVIATTMLANSPSRRVLEKAGMRPAGEFLEPRWPGTDRRAVKYAAHAESWSRPGSL